MGKALLSFVGLNDAGQLQNKDDGAILTALKNENFDKVYLLWHDNDEEQNQHHNIANFLSKEIIDRNYSQDVTLINLIISDVTDQNEIYKKLKSFTDTLDKGGWTEYTASVSSGTLAMQNCWILLSESGDFSKTRGV
ncbi:MAG: RNA repair transcriptional activator RtcR family protein [Ignavibacteriaceae bacterium]